MARQRLDVQQAADALGISTDAVRKRASRGSLDSEKTADGYLYVWVDTGAPNGSTPTQAHLDSLQEQIEFMRRELERKDAILMSLTQRIPEIEAPERSSEARQGDGNGTGGVSDHHEGNDPQKRSWWRRWFGFE